jgi:hydroxyethylthiazole kinase-like uncharacterized protein yjeF
MNKFVSVAEMIKIEQAADRAGHTYTMMMEAAGKGLAESIMNAHSQLGDKRVLALVGKGNNGGDALVAIKYLVDQGWSTCCYLTSDLGENDLLKDVIESGCKSIELIDDQDFKQLLEVIKNSDVLIDGLLGTGFKLPLRGIFPVLLNAISEILGTIANSPFVVAVDIPSGIDCDTGETAENVIKADLTVCMAAYKQGMLKFPANEYLGRVEIVDIGLPTGLKEWGAVKRFVPTADDAKHLIPVRKPDGHKGSFGTLMIVAGSERYPGAANLAGKAAYRSGVGLVSMAVARSVHSILAKEFPEAIWVVLPEKDGCISEEGSEILLNNLGKAKALLIGPGFGDMETSGKFIENVIKNIKQIPLVVDADGLRHLCKIKDWFKLLPENSILTPHPGEMAELTGLSIEEIQEDRVKFAEEYAKTWGQIVVLKGAFTVIAAPSGETVIMPFATSALATAGTGDVLAGLIAGFLAQGLSEFKAAYLGVWIHAQAGIAAENTVGSSAGVIAGDLLPEIPPLLKK